ncbi:xylose isomerase domain-containing protein [Paraburkholderia hospita]|uniref:Xylose isomerase domain-containing protein n=1 Tax=Paraburkholderia hospita TaxID=169430 RepID=A0ABN0F6Y8_9BURK|nr:hypothetical protein [Paraburkholderia hospita]EIM94386.1 xylose isomerase domain-containing protein [Paraburkholderia hospita]
MIHSDICATADKMGFAEMWRILQADDIKHVEFEFLVDSYQTGERPSHF